MGGVSLMYELGGVAEDTEILEVREGDNHEARSHAGWMHTLTVVLDDGQVINDNTDTETVMIKVVDGLEVVKGTSPSNATVLDYGGDVTLSVDGQQTTKTLTNGTVEFDLTTDKSAGSEIEIFAESLADHPAESDSATIEVMSQ